MGEIYCTIELVIQALTPLVSDEISLISGLKNDVTSISNELRSITIYLKDVEERAEGDDLLKESTRQLRLLAYEIEDGIERYQLFTKETLLSKATQFLSFEVHSMASTIKRLLEATNKLAKIRERYGKDHEHRRDKKAQDRLTTSYFQSTDYVDVDTVQDDIAKGEIIELLGLQELNSNTPTIAVVGMRGLGKTTLVDSVYHDKTVRPHFPLRAWIRVQERRTNIDILRKLILEFGESCEESRPSIYEFNSMNKTTLLELLRSYLKEKRYMVVFDDVREDDIDMAAYIRRVWLPVSDNGSKIIMTTRYESVANAWLNGSNNGMYKLNPLPSERAWELFCKKTFRNSTGECPAALEDFARQIVTKCGGLPPAITSLGRLLSTKGNDIKGWETVCDNLGYYLSTNLQLSGMHKTFMEDYYALEFRLKPCLLYFGVFPKGMPIGRKRLIRLWIAEGFIRDSKQRSLTLEEIAEEYVNELILTSYIEAKFVDGSGKVKTVGLLCEFFHEMIQSKLEELSFCKILSSNSNKECIGNETSPRRLSIQGNEDGDNSVAAEFLDNTKQSKSSIRSLFVIEATPEIMSKLFSKKFLKAINLLKVLDLFNAPIDIIPEELGMLLNLRYLSLRSTRVSSLPSSIGKLENLLTLDLKQTFISELPMETNKLVKLRHLLGYYYEYDIGFSSHYYLKINGMKIAQGSLENCLELQELGYLDVDDASHRSWTMELRNLTQLRKLGIIGLKLDDGQDLCSIIDGMKYLLSLNVSSRSKIELIDLTKVKSPPRMLQRLSLNGQLVSIPTWVNELQGLVKICLRWSNMQVDPLETLQLFPNLIELQLLEAYLGEDMEIASHGFQKLKTLHLLDLYHLKSLSIAEKALPVLSELSIGESKNLEVPCDIQYLDGLKTLNFYNMPSDFIDQIRPGKPDYSIVKHVPNVCLHEKHLNGWQTTSL